MDLSDAQRYAREQLDKIPPTKYEVSPQDAYCAAGAPYGSFRYSRPTPCRGCAQPVVAYSQAGAREVAISGMCEPCFDFTMIFPDDRDETEQRWMSLVKYNDKKIEEAGGRVIRPSTPGHFDGDTWIDDKKES